MEWQLIAMAAWPAGISMALLVFGFMPGAKVDLD
jgi:hypothetical protein